MKKYRVTAATNIGAYTQFYTVENKEQAKQKMKNYLNEILFCPWIYGYYIEEV